MNTFSCTVFLVLSVFGLCLGAKLPSSWGRCHRSDPAFNECLRKNIEDVVRKLKNPTPELKLTSFDPLDIPELYIGEGKGSVNVAQHFMNVQLHGLTNVNVEQVNFDFDKKVLKATSLNPNLRLQGEYKMKGQILLLPIVGDGQCNVTLINMRINHVMTMKEVERKGKTFLKVVDFKTEMKPERVEFQFDNLFDGQKELGDNINKVLNDNNGVDVFNDVRQGYEKSFGLIFLDLANRVLPRVAENEIFLD